MEVILLSDVAKLGKKYAIVDVAPGYARNFLFPRNLAEPVTERNAKKIAQWSAEREAEDARMKELLKKALKGMADAAVSFTKKANEEGHLYASVSAHEIAEQLSGVIKADVPVDSVMMDHPIKAVGNHHVVVRIGDDEARIMVQVNAEGESAGDDE